MSSRKFIQEAKGSGFLLMQGDQISAALGAMGLTNSEFKTFKDNCDKAILELNEFENMANSERHASRRNTDTAVSILFITLYKIMR